jgi:hypothetical protein
MAEAEGPGTPAASTVSKHKKESIIDEIINPFHIFGENKDDGGINGAG